MYKFKEDKLTQDKLNLDVQNVKKEFYKSVDDENKRVNIDNAKKRAVYQHMDYDNFKQMVLGANIKPMKTAEMSGVMNIQNPRSVLNANATILSKSNDDSTKEDHPVSILNQSLETKQPENFREFKKYFEKILNSASLDKTNKLKSALEYINQIPREDYNKVFGIEMDVDYLIKVIKIFQEFQEEVKEETSQLVTVGSNFIEGVVQLSRFSVDILKFMTKGEKGTISNWIKTLSMLAEPSEDKSIQERLSKCLAVFD